MDVKEASEALGLSPAHVRRLCANGAIKASKQALSEHTKSMAWVIDAESVTAYAETERCTGPEAHSAHPRALYQRRYARFRRFREAQSAGGPSESNTHAKPTPD